MPGKQAKVVTPPMLKRMLRRVSHSTFPARDCAMVLLSIKAGLRACEIAGLDWSISQMIPVIVACVRDQEGILAIEQPELHVHPAIQVGLGDLFIHAVREEHGVASHKALLVETHSEHIMLRLLRRIRETTENELPPGALGLSAKDLSVIYVESTDEGVRFRPLRVDPEGEFIDRWPTGFFEERGEELF
jgi:predicted ATPase